MNPRQLRMVPKTTALDRSAIRSARSNFQKFLLHKFEIEKWKNAKMQKCKNAKNKKTRPQVLLHVGECWRSPCCYSLAGERGPLPTLRNRCPMRIARGPLRPSFRIPSKILRPALKALFLCLKMKNRPPCRSFTCAILMAF